MLDYILKIILIQAIGLGIYYVFLRNEKLFGYARTFLWVVVVSSFVIPFIQVPIFEQSEIVTQINSLPQAIQLPAITITESNPQSINWMLVLGFGIALISLIQLTRLFFSYQKIITLKKTAGYTQPNIYASEKIQLPFSFLKSIYIPRAFLDKKELPVILAHEQAHIDKKHSRDKIIITLLARVFWFNPLFVLFHKELELIHEYQVDDKVTQQLQIEDYLESLLQSSIYIQSSPIALTHSFFSSPIKNRIIMLHKKSKNQLHKKLISFLSLIIVVGCILCFQPESSNAQVSISSQGNPPVPPPPPPPPPPPINQATFSSSDVVAENAKFPGGNEALIKYIVDNLQYPKEVKKSWYERQVDCSIYSQY